MSFENILRRHVLLDDKYFNTNYYCSLKNNDILPKSSLKMFCLSIRICTRGPRIVDHTVILISGLCKHSQVRASK